MRTKRFYLFFGACVGAVLLMCVVFSGGAVIQAGSWGLSFQTPGQAPAGTVGQTILRQYDAAYVDTTEEKVLYLTFDAGYENGYTPQILDTLKKHEVPAAFFLVGNYLETQPELVQRMVGEGHTVGNHTWSHPDMSRIADKDSFSRQLEQVEQKYMQHPFPHTRHYQHHTLHENYILVIVHPSPIYQSATTKTKNHLHHTTTFRFHHKRLHPKPLTFLFRHQL